jgi:hypothetical protein
LHLPSLEIAVVRGDISASDAFDDRGLSIDALAVGHYIGVRPQNAESAIDEAISAVMSPGKTNSGGVLARRAQSRRCLISS